MHWVLHLYGLVPHRSKELRKLMQNICAAEILFRELNNPFFSVFISPVSSSTLERYAPVPPFTAKPTHWHFFSFFFF